MKFVAGSLCGIACNWPLIKTELLCKSRHVLHKQSQVSCTKTLRANKFHFDAELYFVMKRNEFRIKVSEKIPSDKIETQETKKTSNKSWFWVLYHFRLNPKPF